MSRNTHRYAWFVCSVHRYDSATVDAAPAVGDTHGALQRGAEVVGGERLQAARGGGLRHLDAAQRRVLQVEGQLHHVAQVVPAADVALRQRAPAVYLYCLSDESSRHFV